MVAATPFYSGPGELKASPPPPQRTAGKAQELLITLMKALFYSRPAVSHDGEPAGAAQGP